MNRSFTWRVALAILLAAPAVLRAETPHIGYMYPAGGQQGTTFTHTRLEHGVTGTPH